jgi:colicin import membrane protein
MRIVLLLSFCWLAAGAARAEDIVAPPIDAPILSAEEKQMLQDRARALHQKADLMRQEAETTFAGENNACWQKFLVSSCQADAQKAKTARLLEAHRVAQEARAIDRKLRFSNFAEHQAAKAAEAPKKAADQAEKNRKEREEAMARVEKNRQEAEQRGKH